MNNIKRVYVAGAYSAGNVIAVLIALKGLCSLLPLAGFSFSTYA